MAVVTLELLNENAINLLKELEAMHIVRLIQSDVKKQKQTTSKSRYAGTISKKTATMLLKHVEQSRNEWENR